ncbi:MAG: phosphoenolpyruvate carboxylase [Myxococcaceae bacterium]
MAKTPGLDHPLRRDVRFLGRVLGSVLREHEGEALFQLEERVRKLAIARRRGPKAGRAAAFAELRAVLSELPTSQMEPLIRAFSVYLQLANLAEQHHRVRRARHYDTRPESPPQRGSLADVLGALKHGDVPASRAREAIFDLEVILALTAHPSQAVRQTVLEKLTRIAQELERRDKERLTFSEKVQFEESVRREVLALWQTDELRRQRPTVGDEVKTVVWYLETVLFDQLALLGRSLQKAFTKTYGERLEPLPVPLRFHSWVGGDMDGNPGVTPDVFVDALRAYQARGLRRMLVAVNTLGSELSTSSRHVRVPSELLNSLERDEALAPKLAARQGPRTEGEPWRRKLRFVESRLSATLVQVEARRAESRSHDAEAAMPPTPLAPPYKDGAELEADLKLVFETLRDARAAGATDAEATWAEARATGLHLAELELRAPAEDARAAAAALTKKETPQGDAARFFEALRALALAHREGGERSCRTLILSMAQSEADVLAALHCARAAGLTQAPAHCALDIVPLFETYDALSRCPGIVRAMFQSPEYLAHVRARGVQEIMVGYSDSGKEVGLLAAHAALLKAQSDLATVAAEVGVPLRIFHGRGESVARGGGPAQQAILSLPPGSVAGRYKHTEQGEALDHKYARPVLANRSLELIVGGALMHTLDAQPRPKTERLSQYESVLRELGELGRAAYRAMVWDAPAFVKLFSAITPTDEIAQLPIGSRPPKRRAGGLESLRAIPWVFAWTQNRLLLPGWYGVGSALSRVGAMAEGLQTLRQMYQEWPPFRTILDNVGMVLAKSDLRIAEQYLPLAPPEAKALWSQISDEYRATRLWVKRVTGQPKLLHRQPALRRVIALRNPYVDPMSLLQVELLRRKRAGASDCDRALLLTLSGIAAGMRNTG